MKLKHEYVFREIMGDYLLVPIGETVKKQNGLFIMNETGAFLLGRLQKVQSEQELVDTLLAEYEVDEPTARESVVEFLNKLKELDVV